MDKEYCKCTETYEEEYFGTWLKCECGFDSNMPWAEYCGGCGKKIVIVEDNN